MKADFKILILEDNEHDANLLTRELTKSGFSFTFEIVQTRETFEHALQHFHPDLILSDYSLPSFDAATAFKIKQNKFPHTPFIIVSGIIGEENAVELIKNGVTDYASKDKLFSLIHKINRALTDAEERKEKEIITGKLKEHTAALIVANKELVFQNEEKEKRAAELVIANKELVLQNIEKNKWIKENKELEAISISEKQTSAYARSLIEASLDPLVTISAEGKITDVNEASVKVTGVPRLKLIGTDFSDYFTEPQKAREGYRQVFEKEFVSDYPLTILHKNGKLTDVLYNATVYKDDKGNVLGVFAAARDVTQQKVTEEKIRQSEKMFKSIFDNSLAAIVVTDDQGNYLSANKAAGEVLGYTVKELLQMNVGDLKTTVKHGAAKRFEEYLNKGEEAGEFDFITNKGAYKFVQYRAIRTKADFNLSIMMDITDQKQSSLYARSLIEASLDPLVTISAEGKITDVNEASVKVTGVPRLQLIGTDFSDYFTEPQKAREGYKQVFEKEFVSDYPLTILHKNGKLTDVLYNATVYKDDKGNVLGVFAAARDVTAQKQASQYARILIEASLDPLVTISPEGKITDVNEASIKVTGVPRINLIGSDFSDYFTEPQKAREGYKEVFEKEFVSDYPLTIHHKNGTLTDVLYNASVYKDNKGNVLGVFAAARDVTAKKAEELSIANKELILQNKEKEKQAAVLQIAISELKFQNKEKEKRAADLIILSGDLKKQKEELKTANDELLKNAQLLIKQEEKVRTINDDLLLLNEQLEQRVKLRTKALAESEKQFRDMMETIPQIAWTNTLDGEVTFFNQRWYDYTGLDDDSSKGWGWLSVVHPDDKQSTLDEYRLILKNNVGGEYQNRKRRADGTERWHLIRLMPIKNEEGEVQLWTGTATDIHELRLLQQQKDDFISIASHELKTPITSLKASLQLLNRIKNEPASVMMPGLIDQANKSLEKVIVLIKYLLDASNVNEGQLQLNRKLFTLSDVIKECCQSISIEGKYNVITKGDMEIRICADAERMNQVVINFVTNAIKYAPESKEIMISIEKINDMAKVSVTDKGNGIPSEKLTHLFDRYYRADNSGGQYSGLGLGLYISAEIIKKHNGQIGVKSELGKGSSFWFTLPIT